MIKKDTFRIRECRICQHKNLFTFLQLGPTPLPNGFLKSNELDKSEVFYPLEVCFCPKCTLVQLAHVVSPKLMFKNYIYIPSSSKTMNIHFEKLAEEAINKTGANSSDLVVDIGSNDGTLLKFFKKNKIKILGVDPASNLSRKANSEGIETLNAYFSKKIAVKIKNSKQKAKIITATNVIAHIHDLSSLMENIKILLADNGLFIAEFPYLLNLLEKSEFDTIYQEHLSYFSITAFSTLLKKHGLNIVDIKPIPVHGGSLRVFVSKKNQNNTEVLKKFLRLEKDTQIANPETYIKFRKKVNKNRFDLVQLLSNLILKEKTIVGYGASAKGNILLNYCRIGPETLNFIVDSISYKHGKFTPGMHIPIYSEKKLLEFQPNFVLLLAWNFKDEILLKTQEYRKRGGKIIITVPKLKIIS